MMSFSRSERQVFLDSLATRAPELVIIGGGIVGCSVAAHAARLGLDVLLIEKEDFAVGASGHSTGLAHAGLRYLAQGRVLYVFHESRERRRLQQIAPHWVRPFNFLYPVYKHDAFPLWMVRLGTWIYDRMAWLDAFWAKAPYPKPFEHHTAGALTERLPGLATDGLTGATEYFVDAQLNDHQFTLSFALDAVAHGARIITHMVIQKIEELPDGSNHLLVQDTLTKKEYAVKTKLVLNCAGAWIDSVRQLAGLNGELVLRSRGTHLVIDRVAKDPLIFSSPEGHGRVFFVLPGPSATSIVGTTDIFDEGSPEDSRPTLEEVQSLRSALKRFFPKTEPRIRSMYWGIRPLYKQQGHVSEASRAHKLVQEKKNFWSLPGVKLTAGRAVGEDVARAAFEWLRRASAPSIDIGVLPGADRTMRLAAWINNHPEEAIAVTPEEPWLVGEAGFSATEEMALTLNDFLWRRAKWPLYRDIPEHALRQIAASMGKVLSWNTDDIEHEIQTYYQLLKLHRL